MIPQDDRSPYRQQRWVPFYNDSGEDVPAYGVMRIDGATLRDEGSISDESLNHQAIFTIVKPDTTFCSLYLVNGPIIAKADSYGEGTLLLDGGTVLLSTGTPAYGIEYGPTDDDWGLVQYRPGFLIQGQLTDSPNLAYAVQKEVISLLGKTDASIAKGSSGTVSIYCGQAGSETDTTWNVDAYNRFSTVSSDKWVGVTRVHGNWYLTAKEC